ncbi:MAG: hypothetical protein OHK0029_20580 [Armatimonadaceae bacterium]
MALLVTALAIGLIGTFAIQTWARDGIGVNGSIDKKPAPALADGTWLNGEKTSLAAHQGKVVVLTFWTFGCINCKRTLPFWNAWAKEYAESKDVTVLSVHTPELAFERNPENVREFLRKEGIRFPVLLDNDYRSWNTYGVRVWPTTILIDKKGFIRGWWEGELDFKRSGEFKKVKNGIEMLRRENYELMLRREG